MLGVSPATEIANRDVTDMGHSDYISTISYDSSTVEIGHYFTELAVGESKAIRFRATGSTQITSVTFTSKYNGNFGGRCGMGIFEACTGKGTILDRAFTFLGVNDSSDTTETLFTIDDSEMHGDYHQFFIKIVFHRIA